MRVGTRIGPAWVSVCPRSPLLSLMFAMPLLVLYGLLLVLGSLWVMTGIIENRGARVVVYIGSLALVFWLMSVS